MFTRVINPNWNNSFKAKYYNEKTLTNNFLRLVQSMLWNIEVYVINL